MLLIDFYPLSLPSITILTVAPFPTNLKNRQTSRSLSLRVNNVKTIFIDDTAVKKKLLTES